ncbi:hypothetical protein DL771_011248 [Monosporascus sp. 5C6A]|nr:hypothetical protein DL771_011248 [Monosporascus sp. 5C6A]
MKSLSAALALIAPVQAGLRFPCSTLTFQRLDPVVEPGANPSAHLHHIVGGNAFNATMTGDVGERATCTTCQMSEDLCWDGKNLDSPDHQSHMYNTITTDGFMNAPPCPASHPVRMPQVAFETVWDTTKFNSMWPSGTPNPFVWSFEGTAAGTHADYMFGWKGDSLQRAMDKSECFYDGCGSITKQPMATANQCTVKDMVGENSEGWLPELPGSRNRA